MMPPSKPKLVIIPGIGDDLNVYYTFAKRWNRLGYETHIISFGWIEYTAPLERKMAAFLKHIDNFGDEPLYVIGISAGGTAAINAMAVRSNIKKVITICSPLDTFPNLRNPLLIESIAQTKIYLANFSPQQKQRILSAHALYDPVVDTKLSRIAGIAHKRIYSVLHPPTIFIAMLFYARSLNRFLRR